MYELYGIIKRSKMQKSVSKIQMLRTNAGNVPLGFRI